jgi:ADP-heptose:LPS heptosyltransferase
MVPDPLAAGQARTVRQRVGYALRWTLTVSFRGTVRLLRRFGLLRRGPGRPQPGHLLIVHLTPHLGDVILTMPMIEAVRRANPSMRIDFAVEATAAALLRGMPELDHVYALALGQEPPVRPLQAMARALKVLTVYRRELGDLHPGICLMPRWDNDQYRSSLLAWLLDAPRRVGFASDAVPGTRRAPYRDGFLTEVVHGGSGLHEAQHFLLLAADAGLIPAHEIEEPRSRPVAALRTIAAAQDWRKLAARLGVATEGAFVVLAPGASLQRKIWPVERWLEVVRELLERGLEVVLLSGPSDKAGAEELHELCDRRTILAAGATNLLESVALLSHARMFLGNDSGPGHIAGALGIPTVVLFAATVEEDPDGTLSTMRIRPLGPSITCCPARNLSPCHGGCTAAVPHCITLIPAARVLEAIRKVLTEAAAYDQPALHRP